jgi:AraC-like DNA-binding protein
MTVVFRAADDPAASRDERWRHVLGATVGPLDPRGVPDRMLAGEMGAVRVAEMVAAGEGGATRKAAHMSTSDPDVLKIDVLAAGSAVVEQGGREAALAPGDFAVVDLARPATWAMSGPMRLIAVVFPRAMLPLRHDELRRLTGLRIPGSRGAGALMSSLASQLPRHLDDYGRVDGARLGTAVLDLLAAGLAARLEREDRVPPDSRRRALLLRVHAFIEERLGDPSLTPASIAAAHFISLRYLHRLFESEQTTVADWIRRRRLERCRRDLLDPELRDRPVSAIAERWGIPSAAHFSRLFRAAHGVPPAEYRRNHGLDTSG